MGTNLYELRTSLTIMLSIKHDQPLTVCQHVRCQISTTPYGESVSLQSFAVVDFDLTLVVMVEVTTIWGDQPIHQKHWDFPSENPWNAWETGPTLSPGNPSNSSHLAMAWAMSRPVPLAWELGGSMSRVRSVHSWVATNRVVDITSLFSGEA